MKTPLIVGIGGTTRPGSSSELAVRTALLAAERRGADTEHFGGAFLASLPHYAPEKADRTSAQRTLVEAVRAADGIVIGSPATTEVSPASSRTPSTSLRTCATTSMCTSTGARSAWWSRRPAGRPAAPR